MRLSSLNMAYIREYREIPLGELKKYSKVLTNYLTNENLKSLKMPKIPVLRSLNGSNSHSTLESW